MPVPLACRSPLLHTQVAAVCEDGDVEPRAADDVDDVQWARVSTLAGMAGEAWALLCRARARRTHLGFARQAAATLVLQLPLPLLRQRGCQAIQA